MQNEIPIYFISGLAADRTVFQYLALPVGFTPIYLDWIKPDADETLSDYALRLSEKIDRSKPFVVVGLSFGGMLAVEIAKQFKPFATILISSIPTSAQLPGYFKIAGRLRLHKFVPISLIQNAALLKRLFTTETPDDKKWLKAMIRKSDPQFIRWALHAILSWKNAEVPQPLIHIHGTRDEVLPLRFTKPTHIIKKGGHLMVLNHSTELNEILNATLQDLTISVAK